MTKVYINDFGGGDLFDEFSVDVDFLPRHQDLLYIHIDKFNGHLLSPDFIKETKEDYSGMVSCEIRSITHDIKQYSHKVELWIEINE